jgi:hypothetical protein
MIAEAPLYLFIAFVFILGRVSTPGLVLVQDTAVRKCVLKEDSKPTNKLVLCFCESNDR